MTKSPFCGKWICDPRFAELSPLDMYGRENDTELKKALEATHPDELTNIHTLFRRTFPLKKQAGRCTT